MNGITKQDEEKLLERLIQPEVEFTDITEKFHYPELYTYIKTEGIRISLSGINGYAMPVINLMDHSICLRPKEKYYDEFIKIFEEFHFKSKEKESKLKAFINSL